MNRTAVRCRGRTWIRVDLRDIPVPGGPERSETTSLGEARAGPLGFVIRYTAASGSRFWRILATSADGRTWATFDETATMWTGPLGPRLTLAADAYLMTTNDSAPIGGVKTDGSPMVIGFTTRLSVFRCN